ncbi:DUF6624 domain-containing protein [Dyella sp.]|uniref:DUF6624 domain-containing protein n=1 Tax=Dyella sp. TaxID=1869338 RepID=UPI003F7F1D39
MTTRKLSAWLVLLLASGSASSQDPQDQAIEAACPGVATWQAAQKAAHASQSEEAIAARDAARHFAAPEERRQLLQRAQADQQARDAALAASQGADPDGAAARAVYKHAYEVDGDNLNWLKAQVQRSGFPTVAQVGEQGMSAAFLLVQHADRDPAFQMRVLETLQLRGADKGVKDSELALLTDRVLRAQKKPQRYGTQFDTDPAHPGKMVMAPVEDVAHLDERRARMGLLPIADYRCVLDVIYGTATKG